MSHMTSIKTIEMCFIKSIVFIVLIVVQIMYNKCIYKLCSNKVAQIKNPMIYIFFS